MGLSNVIASGLMLLTMIQVFLVSTYTTIDRIAWISEESLRLSNPSSNDLCSITGIQLSSSGGSTIISVNISNTGSIGWWDYNKSHIILEILPTNRSKILSLNQVSSLRRIVYSDTINPGIVDPGETLSINYTLDNIDPTNILSLKVIFSTQSGGECVSARG